MFISLVKPGADKIKTWTQEQRSRAKQNTDRPVAVESETNNAFVSALCIEDQLFLFYAKLNLDFLNRTWLRDFKFLFPQSVEVW